MKIIQNSDKIYSLKHLVSRVRNEMNTFQKTWIFRSKISHVENFTNFPWVNNNKRDHSVYVNIYKKKNAYIFVIIAERVDASTRAHIPVLAHELVEKLGLRFQRHLFFCVLYFISPVQVPNLYVSHR
jgi:hypothetical protein